MQLSNSLLDHVGGLDINNLSTILQHADVNDEVEHHYPTSYYVDVDSLITQIPQTESIFFSVMTLNIECLSAKFDKLCAFIQVLSNSNVHFSAIAIQETWLSDNSNYTLYNIPGYNSIYQGYNCGRKGGLIIYVLEKFTTSKRDLYSPSQH